ncbi:hypothetical protein RGQ29_022307 [Quercus rubra]|uniref:WEB family protein n=1 Tax=Quercus rubra TaxID=3512 RepID=A0AAN7F3G3_QUERU|nr:hypothetical protein RGQ29_022307 [Quercus rubra]
MAELTKTKEELKRAKDNTMQSWLDSKPLIDELERMKSNLESAKNESTTSNIVISELDSHLGSTNTSIRTKKEEEHKATKMINEISQALDRTREKIKRLKLDMEEEQQARLKLKQVLSVKKQTLQTLQLMLQATQLESEALGASAAEALHYIECSEKDDTIVPLSQEDYYALKRRAEEETTLADWHISVSMAQKLAAEASQNLALTRMKDFNSHSKLQRRGLNKEKKIRDGFTKRKAEEQVPSIKVGASARAKITKSDQGKPPQQFGRSRSKNRFNNRKSIKKKKLSILHKIKGFVRKITRFFG